MEKKNHRIYANLGIGIFLLTAGILLMLNRIDLLEVGSIWDFWPLIIIVIGLGRLLDAEFQWEYRKAFWMLFLGAWFQICQLHLFGLYYHNSWPILIIGIGIEILWKSFYPSQINSAKDCCHGI
jgi:hypothetical protein